MRKHLKKILSFGLAAGVAVSMAASASASEPYVSYNYDAWYDAIPSQSGYRVDTTVTGYEMGLEALADPSSDLFIDEKEPVMLFGGSDIYYEDSTEEFWIADSGNNRILRTDKNLKIKGCYKGVTGTENYLDQETGISTFSNPTGVYVVVSEDKKTTTMYIADNKNSRVVKALVKSPTEAQCEMEYIKPDSELYDSETFNPSKVLVDSAGNLYVVIKSVTTGAVMFSPEGEFTGFYGANRVEVTAAVIRQQIWRKFASDEQLASMTRNVPVEYANFDVDSEGFIYTVTEAANASTDAVKKLNPAGENIWNNAAGNEYSFGDLPEYANGDTSNFSSRLTDIVVSKDGLINILDYETGRIFQYTQDNGNLFIFGTKNGSSDQRGTFTAPNAIESVDRNIYVIDGKKNDITIFTLTTFGEYVQKAASLFEKGTYEEAIEPWTEVIKRDSSYSFANYGLGKAYLNMGDYDKAMKYFKIAVARGSYDRAYEYSRDEFLRENFTVIVIVLLVLIVAIIVLRRLKKKGIISFSKFKRKQKAVKEGK